MSWQNKACLYLSLLILAGCGFQPMYGKHQQDQASAPLLAGIQVERIAGNNRLAQLFRADLEDRLNPEGAVPGNPAYRLQTTLTSSASPIGVDPAGTVSRYNVFMNSSYVLYRNADNKRMTSGTLTHASSYNNITGAYFSTYIAEQDALKRGVAELSEIYRQRLAAYLAQNNGNPPPEGESAVADLDDDANQPLPNPESIDMLQQQIKDRPQRGIFSPLFDE